MSIKLVGITDEVTTCDHCGKTNLKKTFACIDDVKLDGEVYYYGSDCYARLMGIKPKDSRITLDGFFVARAGRIQIRQHKTEFYSVWCAGKLIEIIPIERNKVIKPMRIVLDYQKRDIKEIEKGNKQWYIELNISLAV